MIGGSLPISEIKGIIIYIWDIWVESFDAIIILFFALVVFFTNLFVCDDRKVVHISCNSCGIHSFHLKINCYDLLKIRISSAAVSSYEYVGSSVSTAVTSVNA